MAHRKERKYTARLWGLALIAASGLACVPTAVAGPLTTAFSFAGELAAGGIPASGAHDIQFRLWDSAAAGVQVGPTLCVDNVECVNGRFSTVLDFGAVFSGQQYYLEIEVRADAGLDCSNPAGMTVLVPRMAVLATPNSTFALTAATAGSAATAVSATTASNSSSLGGQAASFYQNATNMTSGLLPGPRLGGAYTSALTFSNAANVISGNGSGLTALNASQIATGTVADARLSANVALLDGANAFTGAGVTSFAGGVAIGRTTASNELDIGASADRFQVDTSTTPGVVRFGNIANDATVASMGSRASAEIVIDLNNNDPNTQVFKFLKNGASTAAASAELMRVQEDGRVAIGQEAPGDAALDVDAGSRGLAIIAESSVVGGRGIGAYVTAGTGATIAGEFVSASTTGTGITSRASATSGTTYGVIGRTNSTSTNAAGVFGEAERANNSNTFYGVLGQATGTNTFGVFANGRLGATGTKSFVIDHPKDPTNRVLVHYCAESPDVLNIYSGVALLDGEGEVWISLPDYFGDINIDPRYTLTSVGAPAPLLHVAVEITDNRFKVAGGAPHAKVSWEVKAVRNDRFIQRYGAPVEQDKDAANKGAYLRPELYDKPAASGQFRDGAGSVR